MKLSLLLVAAGLLCRAQSPAFEIASVKRNISGGQWRFKPEPGRLTATNMTLKALVRIAYGARDFQIAGGPEWFDSDRWDIVATASGAIGDDERKQMLQTLLEDRFKLTIRREMKDLPVYALVPAKNGPKLQPNSDGKPQQLMVQMIGPPALMRLTGVNAPLRELADFLVEFVGRSIIDRTALDGSFDFKLQWAPDAASTPSLNGAKMEASPEGPSIFTAIQEQLGLKLESQRGPVAMFRIERAEKAAEN